MPTGYTSTLHDGEQSFEEFIWTCARAMGALVLMRDERSDAPIPKEFKPSEYAVERVDEKRLELARRRTLTETDWADEQDAEDQRNADWNYEETRKRIAMKGRYEAMLARVNEWEPPTADHAGFKEFMVEQLTSSIDFDTKPYDWAPPRLTLTEAIADAEDDLRRAEESLAEEVERTNGRNAWLSALRDSVPPPAALIAFDA